MASRRYSCDKIYSLSNPVSIWQVAWGGHFVKRSWVESSWRHAMGTSHGTEVKYSTRNCRPHSVSTGILPWRHDEHDGVSNHRRHDCFYLIVCSGADQRKHQNSASLTFAWGIHRWPVNFPQKGPVMRKMFPFDDVIMDDAGRKHRMYPHESFQKIEKANKGRLYWRIFANWGFSGKWVTLHKPLQSGRIWGHTFNSVVIQNCQRMKQRDRMHMDAEWQGIYEHQTTFLTFTYWEISVCSEEA